MSTILTRERIIGSDEQNKGVEPLNVRRADVSYSRGWQRRFEPVDIVCVVRHNKTLQMGNYRRAPEEQNFFLRGFNYPFIFRKLN